MMTANLIRSHGSRGVLRFIIFLLSTVYRHYKSNFYFVCWNLIFLMAFFSLMVSKIADKSLFFYFLTINSYIYLFFNFGCVLGFLRRGNIFVEERLKFHRLCSTSLMHPLFFDFLLTSSVQKSSIR